MKILIKKEHNFFLFQDIVYEFLSFLKSGRHFPVKEKEMGSCSKYIYDSWRDVFLEKLLKANKTSLNNKLMGGFANWMITTNVAILTAKMERGERELQRHEVDYLQRYKPTFLIEYDKNVDQYIANLDEDNTSLFLEAISFYKSFEKTEEKVFVQKLVTYFEINEELIMKESQMVADGFERDNFTNSMLDSYEIMED